MRYNLVKRATLASQIPDCHERLFDCLMPYDPRYCQGEAERINDTLHTLEADDSRAGRVQLGSWARKGTRSRGDSTKQKGNTKLSQFVADRQAMIANRVRLSTEASYAIRLKRIDFDVALAKYQFLRWTKLKTALSQVHWTANEIDFYKKWVYVREQKLDAYDLGHDLSTTTGASSGREFKARSPSTWPTLRNCEWEQLKAKIAGEIDARQTIMRQTERKDLLWDDRRRLEGAVTFGKYKQPGRFMPSDMEFWELEHVKPLWFADDATANSAAFNATITDILNDIDAWCCDWPKQTRIKGVKACLVASGKVKADELTDDDSDYGPEKYDDAFLNQARFVMIDDEFNSDRASMQYQACTLPTYIQQRGFTPKMQNRAPRRMDVNKLITTQTVRAATMCIDAVGLVRDVSFEEMKRLIRGTWVSASLSASDYERSVAILATQLARNSSSFPIVSFSAVKRSGFDINDSDP
ncbi:hypothetical protein OIO90_001686 [Microbotryomycetes sp. JL221]|nr:hypothetical protein OIO90_001686 [Microbotryomycetes sp. JL221]